ncbi:C-type lectin mannose-binding isoform-like [Crassostrea angulata]|uniref:C-type lectin mannose-binding isoform-like n=1 Tax=Magallana angulata TaxID=2784310 RepID=UPI0022B15D3D|nr:C-type lectin mannose-binding isoform-like [Crassostrea angulata]
MLTTWITLTLFLSIGYAANRDVMSKVNCSTLLNKKLFHLHSKLLNVSKTNVVFLKESVYLTTFQTRCSHERCFTRTSMEKHVPGPKICPNGWKSRKGSCYQVFTDKVNWFQAQMNCRRYESTLAHIEDELENKWLKKQFPDIKTATWIDVVDLGKEGKWMSFSSGKTANYLPWYDSEPNNYDSSEHCAFMFNSGTEKWYDGNCTSSLNFMCKKINSV